MSWYGVNTGLDSTRGYILAANNERLFAGMGGGSVWYRPTVEMAGQVYIHPTTGRTVSPPPLVHMDAKSDMLLLTADIDAPVKITLSDLSGRIIGTMFDGRLNAGSYRLPLGKRLRNSRCLIVSLRTGEGTQYKKLLLLPR